ncbi:hypothetical protein B296_00030192 [Ensete ventricosum]|uniref:Uncharacterized protein n=1 Tax=Ensete ventricosum TaxID=4639 RepID=A0A426YR10_ENSVE|nr:hypothetical protein B296_00030192 [Ensete ventricosum]
MTTLTCQPVAFALPCCQPPTVKGVAGWSTYRVGSTMPPAACWQRHRRLVGPLRLLCHAVDHLPAGVLLSIACC